MFLNGKDFNLQVEYQPTPGSHCRASCHDNHPIPNGQGGIIPYTALAMVIVFIICLLIFETGRIVHHSPNRVEGRRRGGRRT